MFVPFAMLGTYPIIFISTIFIVWLIKHHWDRREIYKFSWKCNGPFAWPIIGSALKFVGDTEHIASTLQEMYIKYEEPSLVWVGPIPNYVVKAPEDVAIMLNNPNCVLKSRMYKPLKWAYGESQWSTTSVEKWKMKRKATAPLFNSKMLENYTLVIEKRSEILVDNLRKYVGKGEFDITNDFMQSLVLQIIEVAMGHEVMDRNPKELLAYFENWDRGRKILTERIFNHKYQIGPIFYLSKLYRDGDKIFNEMRTFKNSIVNEKKKERLNKPKELNPIDDGKVRTKCFLDQLLDLNENGTNHFTDQDIVDEVFLFIDAATDTTAYTNCRITTMLGLHPEMQEKIYEEVISVVGDRPIQKADVEQMHFLERFIKETMRLFPAGCVIGRHCSNDVKLTTRTIPKGTDIILGMISFMRDPKYWPDPLKFNPDRFLPEEVEKRHPYAYVPFSGGPRKCIGYKYAFLSTLLVTANLVRTYSFKTRCKKIEDCKIAIGLTTLSPDGHFVEIELRDTKQKAL